MATLDDALHNLPPGVEPPERHGPSASHWADYFRRCPNPYAEEPNWRRDPLKGRPDMFACNEQAA